MRLCATDYSICMYSVLCSQLCMRWMVLWCSVSSYGMLMNAMPYEYIDESNCMASRLYQCILVWICTIIALYAKWRKLGDANAKRGLFMFLLWIFPMLRSAVQNWYGNAWYVCDVTVWKVVNTGFEPQRMACMAPRHVPGSNPVHTVTWAWTAQQSWGGQRTEVSEFESSSQALVMRALPS